MGLHGLDRDGELAGHLFVGVTPGDETEDLLLAGCELVQLGVTVGEAGVDVPPGDPID